jgi:hypothetical protein
MIQINLLNSVAMQGNATRAKKRALPRWVMVSAAIVLFLALGGGAGWYALYRMGMPFQQKPVVASGDYRPSSQTAGSQVEDVVEELADKDLPLNDKTGQLSLPYSQMSPEEQFNYERFFVPRVLALLSRTVPEEGTGLKNLTIDGFNEVHASAISSSKLHISQMIATLREEPIELLPKPHTRITQPQPTMLRADIAFTADFGLNLREEGLMTFSELPQREHLDELIKLFDEQLTQSNLKLQGPLEKVSGEKRDTHRRFIYALRASGSYSDFVRLVETLQRANLPIAFKTLQLEATAASMVTISATLYLSTSL